jgi:hypothetical protein
MTAVAGIRGIAPETVRKWVRGAEADHGQRAGRTTDERARLRRVLSTRSHRFVGTPRWGGDESLSGGLFDSGAVANVRAVASDLPLPSSVRRHGGTPARGSHIVVAAPTTR